MNKIIYAGTADIYVTERCNENCIFCSAQKGNEDLKLNDFKKYVDNWVKYGVKHINITGGEPLLNPDINKFIDYANSKGMNIALFTNGILLKKVDYKSLLSKIEWFAISIDGNQVSNQKLGRGSEHYKLAIDALRMVKKEFPNVKIRIATIVTKENQEQIMELGKNIIDEKVIPDLWRIKQVIPVRRACENWSELSIDDIAYNNFINKLTNKYGNDITIKSNKWQSKSGDLIVTYPSGNSGVTIISDGGNTSEVVQLGNIFKNFDNVLENWYKAVNGDNASSVNYMSEAWSK